VAGGGGEHLPETYGSTLKPKPFVAAPVDCTANNCGLYVKGIKGINIPKTDYIFSSN